MKIAQVAPLVESVPPKLYGGTERIVSYLTEELVRQGHDVTLFASGDSQTQAKLVPVCPRATRLDPSVRDPLPHMLIMLDQVRRRIEQFDLLHFHIDLIHVPLIHDIASRTLTTLHGRLDLPDLAPFYSHFMDVPVVAVSHDQRRLMPLARWIGSVHHGLPTNLHSPFLNSEGGYLAFLGRICPEKRPDRAIEIAKRAGLHLRIAAKVDLADRQYFETAIKPLLDDPLIEYVGEISELEKNDFLGGARALLFPVDWPEPFGLVMIEAMACGTPVVAWRRGSVPEVVDPGVTGYVVESIDEAVEALQKVERLDRAAVRRRFEERFTVERMARDYLALYAKVLAEADASRKAFAAPLHPIHGGLAQHEFPAAQDKEP